MKNHSRSFGLDLARAIAISLVLIAHFGKVVEHFGFWGVELFFGLSGYLIGQILWRNFSASSEWSFPQVFNFWSRRWWRTLPNYFLFCLIMIVFHYNMGNTLPGPFQYVKVLLFSQNLLSRYEDFFGVSWSLCIEEWFYLLFPTVLFIYNKFGISRKTSFISTLITFTIVSFIIRQILIGQNVGHSLRGITFARLDAIGYGVAMAFFFSGKNVLIKSKIIAFVIGLFLLATAVIKVYFSGISYNDAKGSQLLLMIIPLGFSLLLPLSALLPSPSGLFSGFTKSIQNMSLWAYSIYLSHIPVLFFTYYLLQDIRTGTIGNIISKAAGLVATFIVSALLYRYFELPFTNKRPKELKTPKTDDVVITAGQTV